jgi:uncharacterized protein
MSNVDVVNRVYAAFDAQDLETIIELVDENCVIEQDSALPWGGRHVGLEGVAVFAAALTDSIDSQVVVESMFEADGRVYQAGRTRGTTRATGTPFDIPEVHIWTVRDGKAVRAEFAIDTAAMLQALGTDPAGTA